MPRKVRRADEWTDDEIVLAVASCPRERQSYSPRHRNVIELADLIGRSRGAVSHRFANISHLIFGGSHGETHVSERTREIFDEYRDRPDELQTRAAEIRRNLMSQDPTPRVESEVPKEQAHELIGEVLSKAGERGLSDESLWTYEREGSWHVGILVNLAKVLGTDQDKTTGFLIWLADRLGGHLSASQGYDLGVRGRWDEIASIILANEAPELHINELRPQDRITMALRLWQTGSLRHWTPNKRHLRALANFDRGAERQRINGYFGIEASELCDNCTLMLRDLIDRWLKRPRQPA
jgi:hypothetical protein